MITKKVMALLLGISALSCSDMGGIERIELFLAKADLQKAFQELPDTEKGRLADAVNSTDFDRVKIISLRTKKPQLKQLCDDYARQKKSMVATKSAKDPRAVKIEAFLSSSTFQQDFEMLSVEEKTQMALDLQEVFDKLEGVSRKRLTLRELCAPYLGNVPEKQVIVGKLGERLHQIGGTDTPVATRQTITVPTSIADKVEFFKTRSEQLQSELAAKGKDKAPDSRLLKLQTELGQLNEQLAQARLAFESATQARQQAEELNKSAAEGEMRAIDAERRAADEEKIARESEDKAKGINDSVETMITVYELSRSEIDTISNDTNISQRKQDVLTKYGVSASDNAGNAERKIAMATKAERSVLAADMLSQSKIAFEASRLAHERSAKTLEEARSTRERSVKAKMEAAMLLNEVAERETQADMILKDLEQRYQKLSEAIAALS